MVSVVFAVLFNLNVSEVFGITKDYSVPVYCTRLQIYFVVNFAIAVDSVVTTGKHIAYWHLTGIYFVSLCLVVN